MQVCKPIFILNSEINPKNAILPLVTFFFLPSLNKTDSQVYTNEKSHNTKCLMRLNQMISLSFKKLTI